MGEEKEVRREDQEKINRFSRLHSRHKLLEDELKAKQVQKVMCLRRISPDDVTEREGRSGGSLDRAGTGR